MRPDTNLVIAVLGNAANAFVMRYPSGDPQFPHCDGWHPREAYLARSGIGSAAMCYLCLTLGGLSGDATPGSELIGRPQAIFWPGLRDRLWQPHTGFPKWTTGRLALSDISST